MQKTILILVLFFLTSGIIKAQEITQEELVNQFSLTMFHGIKNDNKDTLQSIYPSLQDVKGFLDSYSINELPEEAWDEIKAERAEGLELYLDAFLELKLESTERNFDWKTAEFKQVDFRVETETGEVDLENEETKAVQLDLFYLTILISDGEQTLSIYIDEAALFNQEIKVIESPDWKFRLNED